MMSKEVRGGRNVQSGNDRPTKFQSSLFLLRRNDHLTTSTSFLLNGFKKNRRALLFYVAFISDIID